MDLAKKYQDVAGNECNIFQMIAREPEWVANRFQEGEKAIVELSRLRVVVDRAAEVMSDDSACVVDYDRGWVCRRKGNGECFDCWRDWLMRERG